MESMKSKWYFYVEIDSYLSYEFVDQLTARYNILFSSYFIDEISAKIQTSSISTT
jgi:hypothetical protein